MFNSQLVVIDPISFVPMVLPAHALTAVGKMYERVPSAARIPSSPCLCLLTVLCGEDGRQGKPQRNFKPCLWEGAKDTQVG